MKGGKLSLIFPFFSQMRSLWTVLMFTIQIIIVLTYMRRVFDVSVQPTSRDESIHPKNKSKSSFDCSSRKNQIEWREKKTASPASIESDAQREKFCFRGQRKLRRDVRNLKWNTLARAKEFVPRHQKHEEKNSSNCFISGH